MNYLIAFLTGGVICALIQLLIDYTRLTPARILTGMVVAGVILSAFGLYGPFVDFAGGGATVPLSGFGHVLARGMEEAVDRYGFYGIFTGGLTAAAAGVTSAVVFSLVAALFSKSEDK